MHLNGEKLFNVIWREKLAGNGQNNNHARIQRGGPGVRTPTGIWKFYLKKGNFRIFLGGWTPPRLWPKITIFVGPPLMKISGSAHDNDSEKKKNDPRGFMCPCPGAWYLYVIKHLLWNRLAHLGHTFCGAWLGRGNESLYKWSRSHAQDGHHGYK